MTATIRDAIEAMARAYGRAFIPASATLSAHPGMSEAGLALVQALGGTAEQFRTLSDTRVVALYCIARKSPAAASRKLGEFTGATASAPPPTSAPVPTVPVPTAPRDDSELRALIDTLQGRINDLETATPRVVQLGTFAGAPRVTLSVSHAMLPTLLHFATNRRHVYLVGEAGSGKTTGAEQVAEALGLPFYMNAKVSDETALLGYKQLDGTVWKTPFRLAYENGGVYLCDEIDASDANAFNALNAALAGKQCPFPDGLVTRHPDFIFIGAGNTNGSGPTARYPGRNVLDAASLNRFAMLPWEYDLALETRLGAAQPQWTRYVQALRVEADRASMAALITPRATIDGAHMLSAGMDWDQVARSYLWDHMSPDDARRLQAAVPAANYRSTIAAQAA